MVFMLPYGSFDLRRTACSVWTGQPVHFRRTAQFRYEHAFPDQVWKKSEVRSKANCEACHRDAAQGSYEDD